MANKKWVLSAAVMMTAVSAGASPIDGYTQEASDQNQALLKSVIKMETGVYFSKTTCSATLISKNILLTAKHCVDGMTTGKRITLNENPQYEVVAVEQQPNMAVSTEVAPKTLQQSMLESVGAAASKEAAPQTSSDMALVLFKSTDCSSATLGGVEPVALAKDSMKGKLSNRVLIAGYGITAPGRGDSGTLHAGYNEWVVSDYSTVDPKMSELFKSVARGYRIPENSLIMKSERTENLVFVNETGKKIATEIAGMPGKAPKDGSLPLPGDSGSAAIAFDAKGRPFIVGVTSMAVPNAAKVGASIIAVEAGADKPFFVADLSPKNPLEDESDVMAKAMDDLMNTLIANKYIDAKQTVLKDFGVLKLSGRGAIGTYASVLNPVNYSFVNQSLAKLKKARDAANYCQ